MRLSLALILLSFLFICSVAQAYYTITPDKTFFVGDTTYCFNQTTNVTSIGKDGQWFIVDSLHMMATADNTSILIRINSLDSTMVNFTYSANRSCAILFNCSGTTFTKEYLGGNETIQVVFPIVSLPISSDTTIDDVFKDNGFARAMINLMPIIIAVGLIAVVLGAITHIY